MGINGLFPRLAPACQPTDVISLLRPGLPSASDDYSASASASASEDSRPSKRRRRGRLLLGGSQSSSPKSGRTGRRRVRVAVDASGWIARAAHGQGGHLLDDRLITNYGRAELAGRVSVGVGQEPEGRRDRLVPSEGNSNGGPNGGIVADGNDNGNSGAAAEVGNDTDRSQPPPPPPPPPPRRPDQESSEESYQNALRQEFTSRCVATVLRRVLTLRDECRADVLVVLDGASPPVKRQTVGGRRDRRDRAAAVRDAQSDGVDIGSIRTAAAAQVEGGDGGGGGGGEEEAPQGKIAVGEAHAAELPNESDRISAAKRAGASTSEIQSEATCISAILTALRSESIPYYLVFPTRPADSSVIWPNEDWWI